MADQKLTDLTPFLIRAYYEWIAHNNCRPHIAVNTLYPGVVVPPNLRGDEPLILNISMAATTDLKLGDAFITFGARFNQKHCDMTIPIKAIIAIFSPDILHPGGGLRFNGGGPKEMVVEMEHSPEEKPSESPVETPAAKPSFLRVVK